MCLLMHYCYSKIHFHQLWPFKLIKTRLKSLNVFLRFISSVESLSKGRSQYMSYLVQLSCMINEKMAFANSKCLSTIWSTATILIA